MEGNNIKTVSLDSNTFVVGDGIVHPAYVVQLRIELYLCPGTFAYALSYIVIDTRIIHTNTLIDPYYREIGTETSNIADR